MGGDVEAWHREAVALVHGHRAAEAETLLGRVLERNPCHAPSLTLLGILAGRGGDRARCHALLSAAMDAGHPEQRRSAGLRLAAALRQWQRPEDAEAILRRLLADTPVAAEVLVDLAALLHAQTRHDEAAKAAEQARRLTPHDLAITHLLAAIRNAQGRHAEAAALCLAALERGEEAGLLNTLGVAERECDRLDEAGRCFAAALRHRPDLVDARYNLAMVRKDQARTPEAVALLDTVLRAAPGLAPARIARCMAHLPPLAGSVAEAERHRADYARALDDLATFAERHGPAALADGIGAAQPFYLPYQGRNDRVLQRRYGTLAVRTMGARYPALPAPDPPGPGKRLRLGIVSGHFRDHSVWRLPTRGWLENLDARRFALFGYHTGAARDEETDRAERLCARFVQGPLSLDAWRRELARDRPHALIFPEIGMDPTVARLAAMRLAPVQYASWGHPVTSGYPTIDFFLSSDAMEPADAQDHYTEPLVRLPGLSTPVRVTPARTEPSARRSLGLADDVPVFWCGQSLQKYLPAHDDIFPRIAARLPRSCFLFIAFPGSPEVTARFRRRLAQAFARDGLDADHHCRFLPRMDAARHRALLGAADVVLDSIGWSGCNSLVDALAQGRPIVTLPGALMRARHGAALLGAVGERTGICADNQGYVDMAVALAGDPARRAAIGQAIVQGLPHLADRRAIVALEDHLWRAAHASAARYCEQVSFSRLEDDHQSFSRDNEYQ